MSPIAERRDEAGNVFYRVNTTTKKGIYYIRPGTRQHGYCESIKTEGFDALPSGFYTKGGYGLTASGGFLLGEIHDHFDKPVDLTILKAGRNRLDGRGVTATATLVHEDLAALNDSARSIKRVRNEETRACVRGFLAQHFRQFQQYRGLRPRYAPGTLAEVLGLGEVVDRIDSEDRSALEEFIPEFLSSIPGTLRASKKLQVVYDTLDAGKKIYFEKIAAEFRRKLDAQVQSESSWQSFLRERILVLRNSYGEVLEKESVSLRGKFPDFMLIDPYSYLDIYEIKRPTTTLLRYDRSRDNYYWDTEMSKAISQVENYLHQVQRNSDALMNDIRRSKGMDVAIVRPRGYIVAGVRSQLETDKKRDDFRILSEGLKNIDVILYDDLLRNLEGFLGQTQG